MMSSVSTECHKPCTITAEHGDRQAASNDRDLKSALYSIGSFLCHVMKVILREIQEAYCTQIPYFSSTSFKTQITVFYFDIQIHCKLLQHFVVVKIIKNKQKIQSPSALHPENSVS